MTVRMKSPQCQVQVTRSSTREMLRHLEAENGELRGMIEQLQVDVERLERENWALKQALGYPVPADYETLNNPFRCGVCDARNRNAL